MDQSGKTSGQEVALARALGTVQLGENYIGRIYEEYASQCQISSVVLPKLERAFFFTKLFEYLAVERDQDKIAPLYAAVRAYIEAYSRLPSVEKEGLAEDYRSVIRLAANVKKAFNDDYSFMPLENSIASAAVSPSVSTPSSLVVDADRSEDSLSDGQLGVGETHAISTWSGTSLEPESNNGSASSTVLEDQSQHIDSASIIDAPNSAGGSDVSLNGGANSQPDTASDESVDQSRTLADKLWRGYRHLESEEVSAIEEVQNIYKEFQAEAYKYDHATQKYATGKKGYDWLSYQQIEQKLDKKPEEAVKRYVTGAVLNDPDGTSLQYSCYVDLLEEMRAQLAAVDAHIQKTMKSDHGETFQSVLGSDNGQHSHSHFPLGGSTGESVPSGENHQAQSGVESSERKEIVASSKEKMSTYFLEAQKIRGKLVKDINTLALAPLRAQLEADIKELHAMQKAGKPNTVEMDGLFGEAIENAGKLLKRVKLAQDRTDELFVPEAENDERLERDSYLDNEEELSSAQNGIFGSTGQSSPDFMLTDGSDRQNFQTGSRHELGAGAGVGQGSGQHGRNYSSAKTSSMGRAMFESIRGSALVQSTYPLKDRFEDTLLSEMSDDNQSLQSVLLSRSSSESIESASSLLVNIDINTDSLSREQFLEEFESYIDAVDELKGKMVAEDRKSITKIQNENNRALGVFSAKLLGEVEKYSPATLRSPLRMMDLQAQMYRDLTELRVVKTERPGRGSKLNLMKYGKSAFELADELKKAYLLDDKVVGDGFRELKEIKKDIQKLKEYYGRDDSVNTNVTRFLAQLLKCKAADGFEKRTVGGVSLNNIMEKCELEASRMNISKYALESKTPMSGAQYANNVVQALIEICEKDRDFRMEHPKLNPRSPQFDIQEVLKVMSENSRSTNRGEPSVNAIIENRINNMGQRAIARAGQEPLDAIAAIQAQSQALHNAWHNQDSSAEERAFAKGVEDQLKHLSRERMKFVERGITGAIVDKKYDNQFKPNAYEARCVVDTKLLAEMDADLNATLQSAEARSWQLRGVMIEGGSASEEYDDIVLRNFKAALEYRNQMLLRLGVKAGDPLLNFKCIAGQFSSCSLVGRVIKAETVATDVEAGMFKDILSVNYKPARFNLARMSLMLSNAMEGLRYAFKTFYNKRMHFTKPDDTAEKSILYAYRAKRTKEDVDMDQQEIDEEFSHAHERAHGKFSGTEKAQHTALNTEGLENMRLILIGGLLKPTDEIKRFSPRLHRKKGGQDDDMDA